MIGSHRVKMKLFYKIAIIKNNLSRIRLQIFGTSRHLNFARISIHKRQAELHRRARATVFFVRKIF